MIVGMLCWLNVVRIGSVLLECMSVGFLSVWRVVCSVGSDGLKCEGLVLL